MTIILLDKFLKNESGATAMEYALCVALLALGTLVAAGLLGTAINGRFDDSIDAVEKAKL
jgi:pilus assembly protein Flp/PilA